MKKNSIDINKLPDELLSHIAKQFAESFDLNSLAKFKRVCKRFSKLNFSSNVSDNLLTYYKNNPDYIRRVIEFLDHKAENSLGREIASFIEFEEKLESPLSLSSNNIKNRIIPGVLGMAIYQTCQYVIPKLGIDSLKNIEDKHIITFLILLLIVPSVLKSFIPKNNNNVLRLNEPYVNKLTGEHAKQKHRSEVIPLLKARCAFFSQYQLLREKDKTIEELPKVSTVKFKLIQQMAVTAKKFDELPESANTMLKYYGHR